MNCYKQIMELRALVSSVKKHRADEDRQEQMKGSSSTKIRIINGKILPQQESQEIIIRSRSDIRGQSNEPQLRDRSNGETEAEMPVQFELINTLYNHNNCFLPNFKPPKLAGQSLRKYLKTKQSSPQALHRQQLTGAQSGLTHFLQQPYNHSVTTIAAPISPLKRAINVKTSYLTKRIGQQLHHAKLQTPGSKSSYQQPALSDYNSNSNNNNYQAGHRVILNKMSKHQYNSQEDLMFEDDGTESIAKHEIGGGMNRNYQMTKTEDDNSPISNQKASSHNILEPKGGALSRLGPSAGTHSKSSFFQNYMNPSLYQNSMDQSPGGLQLAPTATAIARPVDKDYFHNSPSQQANSAQYHLRIPNVQGESRLAHQSIVSFGNIDLGKADSQAGYTFGSVKPSTSNTQMKQRRRTLHAPVQRQVKGGGGIKGNSEIAGQLHIGNINENLNKSVTSIKELTGLSNSKDPLIAIKDQQALRTSKDNTLETEQKNFKDYISTGPQFQHKLQRQLKQPQAPSLKHSAFTPNSSILTKGAIGSGPATQGPGSLVGAIDLEISSNIKSQEDNSYQVGSASVPNRESAEDNKSSETMFSGRHPQDTYASILRPRGIEMFQSEAHDAGPIQISGAADLKLTQLDHLQKPAPPGTSQPGHRLSKRFHHHKDFNFSAERYGGGDKGDPEQDSEELDEFEDEIRSPVRNKQQYQHNFDVVQPLVEVRVSQNSSLSKKDASSSYQRVNTKSDNKMNKSRENPDFSQAMNHSPSKLRLGLKEEEEQLRRSQRNHLGKSPKKLSGQIPLPSLNTHQEEALDSPSRGVLNLKVTTGAVSERSKKIVYQKGVSSGVIPSQNISRLELNQALVDPRVKELSYEIEEIVRDIGTSIIEDESFLGNHFIHDELNLDNIDELSGVIGDMSLDGNENSQAKLGAIDPNFLELAPTLNDVRQLHSRLMNKPATGHMHHRQRITRKGPPKKLFDYLPKGRRLILKDPLVAGKFSVLIPVISNSIPGDAQSGVPVLHVKNIQLNPQNEELIKGFEMKGVNINQLPQSLKEYIDYYFKSKHHFQNPRDCHPHQQHIQQSSSQEVRIPQMLSEDQFMRQSLVVDNLNLIQEDALAETVQQHKDFQLTHFGDMFDLQHTDNPGYDQTLPTSVLGAHQGSRALLHTAEQNQLLVTLDPADPHFHRQVISRERLQLSSTEDDDKSVHLHARPLTLDEAAQNTPHNLRDVSNMSNLTSYEFESKILKNNYKEYLGVAAPGSTNQNLNEDLKVINQGMQYNKQQKSNNNRTENITPKYKINLQKGPGGAVAGSRQRQTQQMIFNQDSGTINMQIDKNMHQNHARSNLPLSLPIVGLGSSTNMKLEHNSKSQLEGNFVNPGTNLSQRVHQKQDFANRTASRTTLHAQEQKFLAPPGHVTNRKEDSHRHSLDLSTYSKGNEYLTFYHGGDPNQKILRPIADIFVHSKNNVGESIKGTPVMTGNEGRKTAAPTMRGRVDQATRYASNKYYIRRTQKPIRAQAVSTLGGVIQGQDYSRDLSSIDQVEHEDSQASPLKRPKGLLSEISRQFSEAVKRKNRTQMGFYLNQNQNSSLGGGGGTGTSQNNQGTKLNVSMKESKSQNERSHLGSQRGQRYTITSDDQSPHVGVKNTLMGQQMLKGQSGIGHISVSFNQGPPNKMDQAHRPKTTSMNSINYASSQNQTYQRYLKLAQAGKLQLLGKLNRKAAEVRAGLKSIAPQQQFQFPDTFILSPSVVFPDQRLLGNQSVVIGQNRLVKLEKYGLGTP